MFRRIVAYSTVVLAIALPGRAAPPLGSPAESVLLLQNGEVLRGEIAKVGDRYVATLGNGSELRIAVQDVDMHCLDLNEVYLRKRATITQGSIADHLALADWCLRNSLHGQAADELLDAITIDPHHPQIAWYERRLQSAINQPDCGPDQLEDGARAVSLEELERTMQGLPEDAVETFVSRVQPLLLNRCGANTCHGVRSDSTFRLVRPGWGKTLTRRFTQRNLHAALQAVDLDTPHESPLLLAPNRPHGKLDAAVFGERDEPQVRVLVDWVKQLTRGRADTMAATSPSASGKLMQASYEEPVHLPQSEAGASEPAPDTSAPPTQPPTPTRPGGSTLAPRAPRDAFDPEIFNRRYHPPAQRSAGAATAPQ